MSRHEEIEEDTGVSLRASLEAAFADDGEEGAVADAAPGSTEEEPGRSASDGEPAADEGLAEPIVDTSESGSESSAAAPSEPLTDETASTESAEAAASTESSATESIKAPSSWKPDVREHWSTLPAEVQAEIQRREGEIQKGLRDASEFSKVGKTFKEVVSPYEATFKSLDVTPEVAIGELLKADHTLRYAKPADKARRILGLMDHYGIGLDAMNEVLSGEEPADAAPALDPEVEARIANIEQALPNVVEDNKAKADTMLSTFLATEPEFYGDVRYQMADIIGAGHAGTLEEAYDQAVWANPSTRKVLLSRQTAQEDAEAKRKADEIAAASGSVTGSPRSGNGTVKADPKNLHSVIEAAFAGSSDRV